MYLLLLQYETPSNAIQWQHPFSRRSPAAGLEPDPTGHTAFLARTGAVKYIYTAWQHCHLVLLKLLYPNLNWQIGK